MKKFLYFATGAPDVDGVFEEVTCFPAEKISYFEMRVNTELEIFLTSQVEMDNDSGINLPRIVLTITAGKHKEVIEAITSNINSGPHSNGFVVVADSENSKFCSPHIVACTTIDVVDAA